MVSLKHGHLAHSYTPAGMGSALPPSLLVASASAAWLCLEEGPLSHWAIAASCEILSVSRLSLGPQNPAPLLRTAGEMESKTETSGSALFFPPGAPRFFSLSHNLVLVSSSLLTLESHLVFTCDTMH